MAIKTTRRDYPENVKKLNNELNNVIESKQRQDGLLKNTVIVASTLGLLGGLFFLAPGLTGKVVSDITVQNSSKIGLILIISGVALVILAIIARYFYNKNNKKN